MEGEKGKEVKIGKEDWENAGRKRRLERRDRRKQEGRERGRGERVRF